MDEKAALTGLLLAGYAPQIEQMLAEARAESLAEAKSLLKELMVQGILAYILNSKAPSPGDAPLGPPGNNRGTALPSGETAHAPGKDRDIEQRVAETREVLPTSSADVDKTNQSIEQTDGSAPAPAESGDEAEQLRREIEAIKQKIAQNQQLLCSDYCPGLSQAPPPDAAAPPPAILPAEGADAPAPPVGVYIYGITAANGQSGAQTWADLGVDGVHPVYELPYQGIQVVCSKVSLAEYGQEQIDAHLEDVQWLEARVRAHQRVLETIVASGQTLVPMRFCTIYRSEDSLTATLSRYYGEFSQALAHLQDKREWGVKVYYDPLILAQKAEEVSPLVRELRGEMSRKSSGAAYFMKKKVDDVVAQEVERLSNEHAQQGHNRLLAHADGAVINALQSKAVTGRTDEMILNGAYLVPTAGFDAFAAELAALQEERTDLGFTFELTGPWPPYNFVTIGFEEATADGSDHCPDHL